MLEYLDRFIETLGFSDEVKELLEQYLSLRYKRQLTQFQWETILHTVGLLTENEAQHFIRYAIATNSLYIVKPEEVLLKKSTYRDIESGISDITF